MITFMMVSFTISPNSSTPRLSAVDFVTMMPAPTMNESASAVSTSQSGGILSSTYGMNFSPFPVSATSPDCT